MTVLSALLGAGFAAGLLLVAHGLRPTPTTRPRWRRLSRPTQRRLWGALAAAILVGAVTRWPVGAALGGAGAFLAPALLAGERAHRTATGRTDAIASFTESVRDALSASAGLEQAILAAAHAAPAPIATEVGALASDLRAGVRLPQALSTFRDRLHDPVADLVVAALHQAAHRQAARLSDLLTTLADVARRATAVALRTAAARARVRTSARVVTITTIAMAVALVALNRAYLAPYDSVTGQLVLLLVGGLFAAGFTGLHRLATGPKPSTEEEP